MVVSRANALCVLASVEKNIIDSNVFFRSMLLTLIREEHAKETSYQPATCKVHTNLCLLALLLLWALGSVVGSCTLVVTCDNPVGMFDLTCVSMCRAVPCRAVLRFVM